MLKPAAIFQNGMLLQREKPVAVWGKAAPDAHIRVSIQGKTASATADEGGSWMAELPPLQASARESLAISDGCETIVLDDVAVGEVWIAGGQSNMEFWMRYEKHREEAVKDCENPLVRFYDVPKLCYAGQEDCFDYSRMGLWRKATPEDLEYFSAVGYYFEKEIAQTQGVPVGIIGCNWGGTTSSVWMPRETVARVGKVWIDDYEKAISGLDMDEYWEKQRGSLWNDTGNPFANPFQEGVLPRTILPEEMPAFFAQLDAQGGSYDQSLRPQSVPGCLYERMLLTVAPYAVRGVLWYQGESDDECGHADLYDRMLTALIGEWRRTFRAPELPFLVVQLPGFYQWMFIPPGNNYMAIRKCQQHVAETVPNVWLASISDAGEELDIHPKDKRVVGHRLALLARKHIYGEALAADAPQAVWAQRGEQEITVTFDHAEQLSIRGDCLNGMRLLSGERELPFTASIQGNRLTLHLSELPDELCIQYAQTQWYRVNLYNEADVPALPFSIRV